MAVLQPRTVDDVSRVLQFCHANEVAVVPQGGLTGLAGGATPSPFSVALSLVHLCGIEEIDIDNGSITVLAGTTLEAVQQAARDAGMYFALDIGSRGSCQIGGLISTNAGGNHVVRHGMMRAQVLGLEAVLPDGTVVSALSKSLKNNTGYDIKQLFIGAEGTLGVVTRAVLRLQPEPTTCSTALVELPCFGSSLKLLRRFRRDLGQVSAFEGMWPDYYSFVRNHATSGAKLLPAGSPFYVLAEFQGHDSERDHDRFQAVLEASLGDGEITDAAIAQSEAEAREFWRLREGAAIDQAYPYVLNFDVSVPTSELQNLVDSLKRDLLARWPTGQFFFYGHIGDGNIHLSAFAGEHADEVMHSMDPIVYDAVRRLGGSISAEHGIGALKRSFLSFSRSESELAVMVLLKKMLDPLGIMNPGKIIDFE